MHGFKALVVAGLTVLATVVTATAGGKLANAPESTPPAEQAQAEAEAPKAAAPAQKCDNPNALGVARTVEIDTTGGPGFGMQQYKAYDFLEDKEVILTFDDGPQVKTTKAVLDALTHHCTKAIFFSIGKMALGMPEIIREVHARGQTVGTHTWSHADVKKKGDQDGKDEIERGISAVRRAVGAPIAPFFRFPFLRDSQTALTYLGSRNIAVFSTDIDSFDFKPQTAENLAKEVMAKLEKRGKGILLMHDIQPHTAKAIPIILDEMKAKGFKIVAVKPKNDVQTLAEYDAAIEKDVKGLPGAGSERPVSSVIKTVPTTE